MLLKFQQILTGVLPYANKDRDITIGFAISQKEPPANLASGSLLVPDYVRSILFSCWEPEGKKRPPLAWCHTMLSTKAASICDDPHTTSSSTLGGALELPDNTVRLSNNLVTFILNSAYYRPRC